MGPGSSVSSMPVSKGFVIGTEDNKLTPFYVEIILVCFIYYKEKVGRQHLFS